jgi:hypothetical protein
MFGIIAIAWHWLVQAVAAKKALAGAGAKEEPFYRGKLAAFVLLLPLRASEDRRSGENSSRKRRPYRRGEA